MAVVVQPGLGIEILALEAQWVIHFGDVQLEHIAVSPVARRPAEAAIGAGQFLRGTEVVELVVAGFDLFRAFAVEQGQRAEAVGFVEIGAVVPVAALGEQAFAEPEELGIAPVDLLGDASAEGVVAVGDLAPVRQADADQAVLAVVAVFGDQLLPGAAAFANEIAVGVVVEMPVALRQQAISANLHLSRVELPALGEQVAGRAVHEAFRGFTAYAEQAVQRVVVEAANALAAVLDGGQVAASVIAVLALVEMALPLTDLVGQQAALLIVVVLAEQFALLALAFATATELVPGQGLAVEMDCREGAAGLVAVVDAVAVGQSAVDQLAEGVVGVVKGGPALVLADQAVP